MNEIDTSVFDIFKIGPGPSSSHTIGPMKAAKHFLDTLQSLPEEKRSRATAVDVYLYGSLSSTGKGHGTDRSIVAGLLGWEPETCDADALMNLLGNENKQYRMTIDDKQLSLTSGNIHFDSVRHSYPFQNTMIMRLMADANILIEKEYYSIGGGFIRCKDEEPPTRPEPFFKYSNMNELQRIINEQQISLSDIMLGNEETLGGLNKSDVFDRLEYIVETMCNAVERGLHADGVLPGPIGLERKASILHQQAETKKHIQDRFLVYLNAFALAASEENAAGKKVVTAPTSGSAGVIPSIVFMLRHHCKTPMKKILHGMLAAGAVAGIARHNASISGAEVGCQGEIGVASAMAAALLASTENMPIEIVANAAEIALEHHLGMTCDPVDGYVQIPCVERNAVGSITAYNAYLLASTGDPGKQKITFDQVVDVMYETGCDMSCKYKETSEGGLAVCSITC